MRYVLWICICFTLILVSNGWWFWRRPTYRFRWRRTTHASTKTTKDYACDILKLRKERKLVLWNRHASDENDLATALQNVKDTCNGLMAARSSYRCSECKSKPAPGGRVNISMSAMKYIYNIASKGYRLHVNEIAGACHSCNSRHYKGLAVDVHKYSGMEDNYRRECQRLGGRFIPERNHYHCQF